MKRNADLPAMPQNNNETICHQTGTPNPMHSGLTKREHFAAMAMQGLCSSENMRHVADEARLAVEMADALLAELERNQCQ